MNQKKSEEFEAAVRPLIQWLCENENPHAIIIVRNDRAELYDGTMGTAIIPDYIKD